MTITHYAIYTRTLGEGGAYHVISLLTNEFVTTHWRIVSMSSAFCLQEGGNFLSLVYWSVVHVAVIINGDFTFLVWQPNATVQSIPPLQVFVWFALLFVLWPVHISDTVMPLFSLFLSIVQLWYSATHPVLDKMSSPAFFCFFFHPHLTIHSDSQSYTVLVLFCVCDLVSCISNQSQFPEFIFMYVPLWTSACLMN